MILLLASLPVSQWETLLQPWLRTLNTDRLNLKGDDVLCWTQQGINNTHSNFAGGSRNW